MKIVCAGCGVLLSGSPDDSVVSHGMCSQECWDRALAAKPKGLGVTIKPRGPREPFKQWYSLMHDVLEEGLTLKEASEKYKVSQQTISNYFKRRPDYKAKYLAVKRKRNPPEGFSTSVYEYTTMDGVDYVDIDGYVDGKAVGILTLKKTKRSLIVDVVETELGWTRRGVATALYMAAKEWACARGLTVRSPGRRRNHLSDSAWEKLKRQGLAKRRKNEDYYDYHLPCHKENPPEGLDIHVLEYSQSIPSTGWWYGNENIDYVEFAGYSGSTRLGYIILTKKEPSLVVESVRVEPEWHRKGVATSLYMAAKEWACARGLTVRSPGRRRNHLSDAAWAKLKKKGLAKRRKNGDYYDYHLPCPKENPPIGLDVVVYEDKSNTTFEARLHGMVVGELIIEPTKMYPDHYEVFNIEVPRKAQRQGIATALYAAARDWACARGKTLLSRAVERNEKSTGVWARMGEAGVAVPFTTYSDGRVDWEMPCSKENPPFPVRFRVLDRGHDGFIMNAYGPKGKRIGNLVAVNTLNSYTVINIIVAEEYRKQGIATMLYEKANEEACRRGKPLSSEGYQRSASSNAVWAKLGRMGKAEQDRVDAFGRIDWKMSCD